MNGTLLSHFMRGPAVLGRRRRRWVHATDELAELRRFEFVGETESFVTAPSVRRSEGYEALLAATRET